MQELKQNIVMEAKRIEQDSLYSAKGHFVAAYCWSKLHLSIGIPTAILAALVSASVLSQFDKDKIITAVLAIIVTALTAITTFINPTEKANSHLNAGNKYNSLRNKARTFYEIDYYCQKDDYILVVQLKDIASRRDELNQDSPQIPWWAYKIAKRGIEGGEADYQL
jgi:hypothetical protein